MPDVTTCALFGDHQTNSIWRPPETLAMSLVAYADSSSDSEVDEEEGSQNMRKLLGLLPPPIKGNKSNKQPVRISLPTLKSGSDSDEEEDGAPTVKRVKTGGSGLTALLPLPKAVPKQLGAGRASTRSMVPYTLSKRKQDSIKSEKAQSAKAKLATTRGKLQSSGDGSDSDEEPVSFFPHLEETAPKNDTEKDTKSASLTSCSVVPQHFTTESVTTSSASNVSSASDSSVANLSRCRDAHTVHISSYASVNPSPVVATVYSPTNSVPHSQTSYPNFPCSWDQHSSTTASYPYAKQPYTVTTPQQCYGGHTSHGTEQNATQDIISGSISQSKLSQTNTVGVGGSEVVEEGGSGGGGELLGGAGPGITIDQESLRRLAGGGMKRRGREDALNNIVDVMGDDVMDDIKVYQRHYGEDPAISKLYKADTSKLKAPSGQQKRKHQITWLAHEAKERELELQKQWATGSQARRDARSKYGF